VGWLGEQAQVAVVEFEDLTHGRSPRRGNLLGRGMEAHLVSALRHTGRFSILEPQEKIVRTRKGETIVTEVGSHEEPEFFISGSLLTYSVSQASVAAGIAADPLLGTAETSRGGVRTTTAERLFSNLSSSQTDQVEFALYLLDGKTGRLISETRITATPQDLSSSLEGVFSADLLRMAVAPEPPTQRAVRASIIKAVNWIADHCQQYRREQAHNPNPEDPPLPLTTKKAQSSS
jgi:curli biogenesis system outer membrane secretion channel CsgG